MSNPLNTNNNNGNDEEELNLPVHEEELEGRTDKNDLPVWVNGAKARMHINNSGNYSSTKVWILFEEKHEWFDNYFFATKYYDFESPGILCWGHDKTQWTIQHRDNDVDPMVNPPKEYWGGE